MRSARARGSETLKLAALVAKGIPRGTGLIKHGKLAVGLLALGCALALTVGGATAAIPCIPGVSIPGCEPSGGGSGPSGPDGEPAPPPAPPAPPANPCPLHRSQGKSV